MKMSKKTRTILTTDMECDDMNSLIHLFLYLNELKNNYRVISREKINEEKLNRVVNESINSLNVALPAPEDDEPAAYVTATSPTFLEAIFCSLSPAQAISFIPHFPPSGTDTLAYIVR